MQIKFAIARLKLKQLEICVVVIIALILILVVFFYKQITPQCSFDSLFKILLQI